MTGLIEYLECYFGILNIVLSLELRTTPQSKQPRSVRLIRQKSEKDVHFFDEVRPWDAGKKKFRKVLISNR